MERRMELLIWGAGGHAAVVADIARQTGWTVVGFVDDWNPVATGQMWCSEGVVDSDGAEALVRAGIRNAAVAIGNPRVRLEKANRLTRWGCTLPPLIHPRATVAESAVIGDGTVVCAGAVVQPLSRLGGVCLVNTLASVDHECELNDAVHICPGARLGGHVRAGAGVWVGIGASVRDRIQLGDWSLIGTGAAVVSDIPARVVAYGVPATPRGPSPYAVDVQTLDPVKFPGLNIRPKSSQLDLAWMGRGLVCE
jgi:UDP-N-acetylbacillosamine N-acetyltransferase